MPLIYFNCPEKTFSLEAKDAMVQELTDISLNIEKLPNTDFVKSTCWIYFNEFATTNVYHGGLNFGTSVISLEVNTFKGGLDKEQKREYIKKFTRCIHQYAGLNTDVLSPVYILFRDVKPGDWGVFGITITLEDLRHPPAGAKPI